MSGLIEDSFLIAKDALSSALYCTKLMFQMNKLILSLTTVLMLEVLPDVYRQMDYFKSFQ